MAKQTLEEAAEINCESITHPYCDREKAMFISGAKWQKEQDNNKYSEEEVLKILDMFLESMLKGETTGLTEKWFEQFKNK